MEAKVFSEIARYQADKHVHVPVFNSERTKVLLLCLSPGLGVPPHSHPGFDVTLQPLLGKAVLPGQGGQELVLEHMHLGSPTQLIHEIYYRDLQRHAISGLAALVQRATDAGDAVAEQILTRAGAGIGAGRRRPEDGHERRPGAAELGLEAVGDGGGLRIRIEPAARAQLVRGPGGEWRGGGRDGEHHEEDEPAPSVDERTPAAEHSRPFPVLGGAAPAGVADGDVSSSR